MNLPEISGSIDVAVVGALIVGLGKVAGWKPLVVVGVATILIGMAKVTYDHLTGFDAGADSGGGSDT